MEVRRSLLVASVAGALALTTAGPAGAAAGTTTRVSVSSTGTQGNGLSAFSSISADGRYVAFVSQAANLVPGDTNGTADVFVRDRRAATTTRVSVSSTGAQADKESYWPSISADGRHVAFSSEAANLVPGDTNGTADVFVRDRRAATTTRVSGSSTGAQGNGVSYGAAISADGRYVAFYSDAANLVPGDTNGATDVFVRDRRAGTTARVSVSSTATQANGRSYPAAISADGRYVAFVSQAANLVPGDTNGTADVFVRDRRAVTTTRVSVSSTGAQADKESYWPSISADGRHVTFYSDATNLVPGDTNGTADVFVRDRRAATTTRVSVSSTGAQGNGPSAFPSISADGRYVAFDSGAASLVPGDTNGAADVFVRDRRAGTTTRVSVSSTGAQGNGLSRFPAVSANGRYVVFGSLAANLVSGDTNGTADVFIRDRVG